MRDVFYAPSGVASLDRSPAACLTFFDFPKERRVSLRTTNLVERYPREFLRRPRPINNFFTDKANAPRVLHGDSDMLDQSGEDKAFRVVSTKGMEITRSRHSCPVHGELRH
ncbi:MAG TPA: transposase [Smithellaceae bacterium]|jgi:hypothetical protein|nr:transposase [Smithellaceae bacterium]